MSKNEKLVLDFSRTIPAPFDDTTKVPRKMTTSATRKTISMHTSTSTQSTLCKSVVKMLLQSFAQKAGNERGGVGTTVVNSKEYCVAEYKSSVGDEFHVVVYDVAKGNVMASVYDYLTGSIEQYKCNASNRDGSAILLAMLPVFLKDQEFADNYDKLYQDYLGGWIDIEDSATNLYVLSDNVYRRIKDSNLSCYTPLELDASGNIARVTSQAIGQGTYEPQSVVLGGFEILSTKSNSSGTTGAKTAGIKHEDFIGKYKFSNRQLTVKETSLIPTIPEHIIITKEAEEICKLAQGSTGKPAAMRNFLMRGGAGSGKTWTAKQVAAGLGLPEVTLTCHPDLSIDELIGQMLPKTSSGCEGDFEVLNSMGGVTLENVAKLLNLPDFDAIEFEPEDAYKQMTGNEKEDATPQECFSIWVNLFADKIAEINNNKEDKGYMEYEFVEGVLLQAIKYGWVCEIQEPTVISRPGVLAGLNSILEQEGSITLPDGRVIKRHPDAVVVVTTNISYEGCRGLNQSVLDRMSSVYDVETPTLPLMVERAVAVTGETDEQLVGRMAQVVCDVAQYCKEHCITSGITGMRVLIDWVTANQILGNPYRAALSTLIAKATEDEEERIAIQSACLDPMIAPSGPVQFN